ncbi:phenylalanine--tRNA ligase subunit beta [Megamonas funiformis]|jgi:phenylalanyl-tRNA synthetase beta chain|uniref:Phenylalanine--tRNA ligase beta subunit n=2 Tax=Megamonas funiformis TaxID=437897 RepID=A0ABP2NIU0_9FIRM|nr:phenylalanine--tRNA ligase subunit beta [Megamonas funiformis]EHR35898.1 phenylalanine-tRNA ligase, beta subunit [Megamonas funiformis YIT 11815]QIB59138.1 phenylalanine--tRNA ligase subunit beta [Megamonas funiformis]
MQVSIKWLKDYIDFTETPEQLADKLTMAGIPVENVVDPGEGLEKVVTGRIEKLEPHQNSDHLQICTMNVGLAENIIIVTGAQNVAEGQVVPVAMVGAHLPNGMKISKGKLRGVASNGMLCSAQELKLDLEKLPEEQKTGIFILPSDTPVGIPAKDVLGLNDVVLEFELTANRADCFSVFGLVREIAAITGNKPHFPEIKVNEDDNTKLNDIFSVEIADPDLCSRFSTRMLKNVKIGPSPEWMQQRLEGAGIRSINNVVDVTNFVMIELGHPMHAYDYDKITGKKLIARRAIEGEELHTLDDTSRKAKGEMLVIADSEKAAGLAGIMGGFETEITDTTTTVVLESADFYGPCIRRTARACGLSSEASGRFERGVDSETTIKALDRAAQLLQEMGACTVCEGIVDVYPNPKQANYVTFTPEQINNHLGTNIAKDVMLNIITSVGFDVTKDENDEITVKVPSWRNDVTCMADISEEIARLHGFDKIKSTLPNGVSMQGTQSAKQTFIDKVKASLSSQGLYETISFALTNEETFNKLNIPQDSPLRKAVPIMNPLSDEYPLVRTTLLSSIFDNLARNLARKNDDVALFEVGSVFFPKALPVTELPDEVVKIAGAITGRRNAQGWNQTNDMVDFYDAKGIIEELLANLRVTRYTVEAGTHYAMHPGKTALFKKGRDVIATVGEVHPAVLSAYGITKPVYIFELDATTVMKYMAKDFKYKALPKYPATSRDLAMLVDVDVNAADIEKAMTKAAGQNLTQITLFDVYTGKQVEEGKKSLAFSLTFQSNDKTLTDAEIDPAIEKIVAKLQKDFNANLRG